LTSPPGEVAVSEAAVDEDDRPVDEPSVGDTLVTEQ
jgi:hypothetical protein